MVLQRREVGFTLIEILIVISIIAILASMTTGVVIMARQKANAAAVTSQVNDFAMALERFKSDEGYYPGKKYTDLEENAFPALFEALLGEPRSKGGKGGRSAPYLAKVSEDSIVVFDENEQMLRVATTTERYDPEEQKFILDRWGQPFWFRECKSKKAEDWMHNRHSFDVWSVGQDKENQTLLGEKKDDIGNW